MHDDALLRIAQLEQVIKGIQADLGAVQAAVAGACRDPAVRAAVLSALNETADALARGAGANHPGPARDEANFNSQACKRWASILELATER